MDDQDIAPEGKRIGTGNGANWSATFNLNGGLFVLR